MQKEVKPISIPPNETKTKVKLVKLRNLTIILVISAIALMFVNFVAKDVVPYLSNLITIGAMVLLVLSLICLSYYRKYREN